MPLRVVPSRGGFLPRHDEDLREPLVRRQGSQVSMRVARGSVEIAVAMMCVDLVPYLPTYILPLGWGWKQKFISEPLMPSGFQFDLPRRGTQKKVKEVWKIFAKVP